MYSTIDDLKKAIPEATLLQLTDDDSLGVIDEAKVTEAIAAADGEIDSYCAARYTVPFDPAPAIIGKYSVDIAIYNLYSRIVETIPDTRNDRYKNAIRALEQIAKGVITLGQVPAPPEKSSAAAEITSSTRLFTRDSMKGL